MWIINLKVILIIFLAIVMLSSYFLFFKTPAYKSKIIDMHEHYRIGGNITAFLSAMDKLGISKVVFLGTGTAPDNKNYETHTAKLLQLQKQYPDRIIVFCTIDEQDENAVNVLEDCVKNGGKGLKLMGGHPDFYDEPLNSSRMYKVYRKAQELGIPVLLHGSIINIPSLEEQLEQVYADFPNVIFIHAHYCSSIFDGINLERCERILDKHPNVFTDLSMGGGIKRYHKYFKENITKIRDFIIKYQDRIVWGSDLILDETKDYEFILSRMLCDLLLHQKSLYVCEFSEKQEVLQGFHLPEGVLVKIYVTNPKMILKIS